MSLVKLENIKPTKENMEKLKPLGFLIERNIHGIYVDENNISAAEEILSSQ